MKEAEIRVIQLGRWKQAPEPQNAGSLKKLERQGIESFRKFVTPVLESQYWMTHLRFLTSTAVTEYIFAVLRH